MNRTPSSYPVKCGVAVIYGGYFGAGGLRTEMCATHGVLPGMSTITTVGCSATPDHDKSVELSKTSAKRS